MSHEAIHHSVRRIAGTRTSIWSAARTPRIGEMISRPVRPRRVGARRISRRPSHAYPRLPGAGRPRRAHPRSPRGARRRRRRERLAVSRRADPRLDARDPASRASAAGRGARRLARRWAAAATFAVAVRSSATAEDLPEASFAGQQETFLNVRGEEQLLTCMHEVYASLYNDRAIAYRVHSNFDHGAVALSVGVQHMVRSDLGARRRDVHARHRLRLSRRRVHHLGLRPRRNRRAGRRQSGRVLRLQAGAARRAGARSCARTSAARRSR